MGVTILARILLGIWEARDIIKPNNLWLFSHRNFCVVIETRRFIQTKTVMERLKGLTIRQSVR
jgi:hypothetical protein